jgi:hypothetical protein
MAVTHLVFAKFFTGWCFHQEQPYGRRNFILLFFFDWLLHWWELPPLNSSQYHSKADSGDKQAVQAQTACLPTLLQSPTAQGEVEAT